MEFRYLFKFSMPASTCIFCLVRLQNIGHYGLVKNLVRPIKNLTFDIGLKPFVLRVSLSEKQKGGTSLLKLPQAPLASVGEICTTKLALNYHPSSVN